MQTQPPFQADPSGQLDRTARRSRQGRTRSTQLAAALATSALLFLAACGGGGGGTAIESSAQSAASGSEGRAKILAAAPATGGGVMINEVMAAAWKGPRSNYGDSDDWVELYNPADTAVDLSGYGLSNKTSTPFQWTFPSGQSIPAKGTLIVWLSKRDRAQLGRPLHTNFNLDNGADALYLTASNASASGILVDSAAPPLLAADHSWCRSPSGVASAAFVVCEQASFNAANSGTTYSGVAAMPTLSLASGFYAAAQTVTVSGPAGATLRYTLDGSEPSANSTVYTGDLAVASSRVLRVAAFAPGLARSRVMTGTYIVDVALAGQYTSLKAMMVAMAPADFAAFEANNQEVDFRASFELIRGGTTSQFKMDAEGSAGGGSGSADSPQRTMNVSGRDGLGVKAFPGVLWADKPQLTSHRKFRLRNGSNDWARAHLRDQLSQKAGGDGPTSIVGSATTVAMFVNGVYYGMMDLREREDENMPANNLKLDKDYVDFLNNALLPGGQEIKNGGDTALANYTAMHNYIVGNDMAVAANYAQAKTLMNPESLAWDWALHMFHANYDWPDNNTQVWRTPELDGRWTWKAHDMDFAFGRYLGPEYNMNGSFTMAGSELINALLKSPEFRTLYLNTVADQMNIMTPAVLQATLDDMAAEMRPYVAPFYAKNGMGPATVWEGHVSTLRGYFEQREPIYDGHNRAQFGLSTRQPITVTINDVSMGAVKVNQVDTGKFISAANPSWSGRYYPGVPLTLEAMPKPGFRFVGWEGASTSTEKRIQQTLADSGAGAVPADNFSVRWTGTLEAPSTGTATLQTVADDGVRVWFNNQLVIDNWADQAPTLRSATVNFTAGQRVAVRLEYYDNTGGAEVRLSWQPPGTTGVVPVPRARLYPEGAGASAAGTGTGLSAQYFANIALAGTPVLQRVEAVDWNWGSGSPTPASVPAQLRAVFAAAGAPAQPTWSPLPAQNWRTGDVVRLPLQATDPGGYPLTYTASNLPKGLSLNAKSGVIYGRLTTPVASTSTLSASNGVSTGTLALSWTVLDRPGTGLLGTSADSGNGQPPPPPPPPPPPANLPPSVAVTAPASNSSFAAGATITVTANAADSDGSVTRVEFFDGSTLIGTATSAPYSISWTGAGVGPHSLSARAVDDRSAVGTSAAINIVVAANNNQPPANAVACAEESGTCTLPAGVTATVWYGEGTRWTSLTGVTGSIGCNNQVFGDPNVGVGKFCVYVVTATTNTPPTVVLTAPGANSSVVQGTAVVISANAADPGGAVVRVEFYAGSTLVGSDTSAPYSVTWNGAAAGSYSLTAKAVDNAGASTTSAAVNLTVTGAVAPGTGTGLTGQYFASNNLTGAVRLVRVEGVNFDWGGSAPGSGVPSDNFSVRWSGQLQAPVAGVYQLQTTSDDGIRVWVDGRQVINNWTAHAPTVDTSSTFTLAAGQRVNLVVEYQEFGGEALAQLRWKTPADSAFVTVPSSRLYSTAASLVAPLGVTALGGSSSAGAPFIDPAFSGQKMTGVTLRAGSVVYAVQALTTPTALPAHGGASGGNSTSFSWPSNEYLVRMTGVVNSSGVVTQVSFVTNTGRTYGPYGKGSSSNFSRFTVNVPAGSQAIGFAGRSGDQINAIGLVYGP